MVTRQGDVLHSVPEYVLRSRLQTDWGGGDRKENGKKVGK